MLSPDLLITFLIATVIFAAVPGPAMLYAAARTMAGGRSAGLMAAFDFGASPRRPQIISGSRSVEGASGTVSSPSPVIYSTYGLALVLVGAVVTVAAVARSPVTRGSS